MTALRRLTLLILFPVMALFGCGKANDQAPTVNNGAHPANWLVAHRLAYYQNPNQCQECHGADLKGGITKIDCFNQAGLGQCHAGGHGPRLTIHVIPFTDPALHGPQAKKDLTVCQGCHGTPGGAGSNPRFNIIFGSMPAGCESPGCHNPKMAHPTPWATHNTSGNQANACALCHGATFSGGVGPACSSCHTQLVAGTIPVLGQCVSCHSNPPNGTTAPNIAGSHAVHLGLSAMSGNCAACHTGGGSGTTSHGTGLTLAFAATFNANAGPAAFNGTTCTNTSCHGGQPSPAWGTTLDVSTSCTSCHQAGTAENISYHSGQHNFHLTTGLICTDCHDMSDNTAHFANVTTKIFETQPSTTLRSYLGYSQQSCTVSATLPQGVQFTACHSGTRSWN